MIKTTMKTLLMLFGVGIIGSFVSGISEHKEKELTIYKVEDYDFENTRIKKICLVGQFNATFEITQRINDKEYIIHNIELAQNANTTDSFCNVEYTSELKLHFDKNSVEMAFFRKGRRSTTHSKITTYCDHCDYGTWILSKLETALEVNSQYKLHASMIPKNLHEYAKELANGIDIKRAFKCEKEDRITVIPLQVRKVINSSSHEELATDIWSVNIKFYFIQVQPFLVRNEPFYDPYLCRDISVSLLLIITLPLVYFIIFILFYRIKAEYGCPPQIRSGVRKKQLQSYGTETCMEESTNIMSEDFNTIQFGLTSTSSSTGI